MPSVTLAKPGWSLGGADGTKAHYLAMDLPHSDGCYVKAYPAEPRRAFCDGQRFRLCSSWAGCPTHCVRPTPALRWPGFWLRGQHRRRTMGVLGASVPLPVRDRFGRPGKGNDKGKVEGWWAMFVALAAALLCSRSTSFDALNAYLEQHCSDGSTIEDRGHNET